MPFTDMPHARNPERDWVGTANHYVALPDADYYYSNFASPSYRYRRLIELFDGTAEPTVDDHWAWQLDARNLLAESIAPIFAEALSAHDATRDLGEILAAWDHVDAVDAAAPLVFQETMRQLALATFRDELGESVADVMLDDWYFWQERFERMVLDGRSTWFDDVSTAETETLPELIRRAGEAARTRLAPEVGPDPRDWRWGDVHHLTFTDAIRRDGPGARWLGSGPHPAPGSGETLHRGWYDFPEPFGITHTASLRMVIDLGDPEKVRAVLPGGVAGRLFHPHRTDQIDDFVDGSVLHWWFSDRAIDLHAEHRLRLVPVAASAP
ncbi:MAG: penicillin acylase family protein [Acidobacteriota bacterium]